MRVRSLFDQPVRFEVLAGIENLNGCTVLDAGPGDYYGVEQLPEMLKTAKKTFPRNPFKTG